MKIRIFALGLLALLLGTAADATAATLSQQFRNDFDANRIWLWAVEPTTTFTNITFDSAPVSSWLVTADTGDRLFFESDDGSVATASTGFFTVDFAYVTPGFAFEWAEIFWDGATNTLLGAGTAAWNGAWSGSASFTHAGELATVPVPSSIVFLASGAVFVGIGFGRQTAK